MRQQQSPAPDRSGYLSRVPIAALASPVGGSVALVRVSGPGSVAALSELAGLEVASAHRPWSLFRVDLRQPGGGERIDDAVAAYFEAPKSFTGEESVELFIHGGAVTATEVMGALARLGIRQALPGEFSFRAVRNGKMTLSQAQATADLIGASNRRAADLALEKMGGSQNRLITDVSEDLRQLAALGEVGIDFADQDVDEVSLVRLRERVTPIRERLERLRSSYARGSRIQEGIRAAFVGLPNAGKSSFFNALLGEDRSIVSDIPGTTRDIVRERLTLAGSKGSVTLRLEDTAGLRESEDRVERLGVERTQKAAEAADLIILVVDASVLASGARELWAEWQKLGQPARKTIGILTKADLVPGGESGARSLESHEALEVFGISRWIATSARSEFGIAVAAAAIADFCESWVAREPGEVLLTRQEHVEAVEQALSHLERGALAPEIDLFASDLRHALHALAPLVGETVPDDILGRVFSQFCIGK